MKTINRYKFSRKGAVLAFAVIIVVVMILLGLALLRIGLAARIQAIKGTAEIVARQAADAGLAEAKRRMDIKWNNLPVGTMSMTPIAPADDITLPGADATYSYVVKDAERNLLLWVVTFVVRVLMT